MLGVPEVYSVDRGCRRKKSDMPVTLADIARELDVSMMTVSRAINNRPTVNAQTRERVLEAARKSDTSPIIRRVAWLPGVPS